MKNIFISVVLSFCALPSVSYSNINMRNVASDKIFLYMKALREGDYEGCVKVRHSIDNWGAEEQKGIKKAMKGDFKSAYENGDNIFHFIVRLEQSEAVKQMGDYRALVPDMKFVHDVLGSKAVLKLLREPNDTGIIQKDWPMRLCRILSLNIARQSDQGFLFMVSLR